MERFHPLTGILVSNIYSCDDLSKIKNLSGIENFYKVFDYFSEVVVLLNKFCSQSTDIDDLETESLRYFL